VVWQAWDRQRTADVAVKILHRFDSALMRRFKQEFRTLADVRHRNIVRFHELFEIEERLLFSMELIDGVDVLAWVWGYRPADAAPRADEEDTCPFDEDTKPNVIALAGPKVDYARLRDCFAQLVRGLAHLHGAGYLHRDLKPSNLMVRRDGRLMILDFGLAVSLLAPLGGELEAAVGTIAYMAPEVAEQRTADARADYYSLGVLLFEAITGRTPFCGDHIEQVLAAKVTREAPWPSSLVSDVPEDLDQLCHALLQRDPATRAGASELARGFLAGGEPPLPMGAVPRARGSERSIPSAAPSVEHPLDRLAHGSGPVTRPPVVGRGREVERLRADLASVGSAGLQCRLVTGPSGIGKSAFAEELARTFAAQPAPATVLMGRCNAREAIPFRAIDQVVDALAQHLAGLPTDERARLTPPRAHLLAELFPVLRGLSGEHVRLRPRDPGVLRLVAFAALREMLTALALTRPLVLMIDDLHLADPDSLDLIAQVFLGVEAPPLLFIGLGRPGAVLDQLSRIAASGNGNCNCNGRLERLELGPLQGEQAEQVARALATYMDIELPDASSVAMDTRGHPGFTYEILRAGAPLASVRDVSSSGSRLATGSDVHLLASSASPPATPLASDSLPALASVLTTRILALDEPGRRMIELLCAIDGPCSVQLAADLLDLGLGDIAAALDDLVDADLVVATGRADDDAFELYHERIRDVAEATLGDESFAAINRTLAEALEERGDADPVRLLRHWQLAGEPVRAAHYRSDALATASINLGVLQPLRGRAYQQRHLEVARQVGDRVRYLRALGAEAAWAACAGSAARPVGDRFTLTLLTTDSSIAAWLLADDVATAERQLEEAERTWDEVDAPMQRWLIATARVQLELYRGKPAAARAALEPALACARHAGLHQVETLRVAMLHLELRTALALAAAASHGAQSLERALHLERASTLRRHLAGVPAPWAQALAALAAATCLEHAGHADPARRAYRTAERALTAAGLLGYAAAAAWAAAALAPALPTLASLAPPSPPAPTTEPTAAGAEISQAHLTAAATAQGIAAPARFFAFLVGG
jgi:eukaryotic-like serine/threonine-protein kinase